MNPKRYPLANDLDGNPVELPPNAVAWRVRRRSGKQGRPQCVYDHETGAQLELPLDATIDDLRPYGPGVYRLDPIDQEGRVIAGIVCQTEVPMEAPEMEPSPPYGGASESSALIRHLVDANVRVMEAMASAFGHVRPVQAAPTPIVIETPEAKAGDGKMSDMEKINTYFQMAMVGRFATWMTKARSWSSTRRRPLLAFVGSKFPTFSDRTFTSSSKAGRTRISSSTA